MVQKPSGKKFSWCMCSVIKRSQDSVVDCESQLHRDVYYQTPCYSNVFRVVLLDPLYTGWSHTRKRVFQPDKKVSWI